MKDSRAYSVTRLSRRWRVRPEAVKGLIEEGKLTAVRVAGRLRILAEDVASFERRNGVIMARGSRSKVKRFV